MEGMNAKKPADDKPEPRKGDAKITPPTEREFKAFVGRMLNTPKPKMERKGRPGNKL